VAQFTTYARSRMAERGVSEVDVDSALAQEVRPPRPGNRPGRLIRSGLDTRGRMIEVVQNEHGEIVNVLIPRR